MVSFGFSHGISKILLSAFTHTQLCIHWLCWFHDWHFVGKIFDKARMTLWIKFLRIFIWEKSAGCYLSITDTCVKTHEKGRLELNVVCEKPDKSVPMTTNITMSHATILVHIQTPLVATLEPIPVHSDVSFEWHVLDECHSKSYLSARCYWFDLFDLPARK